MNKQEAEQTAYRTLPDEWVVMYHPEVGETSYSAVPVVAFEETWKELGWEKANLLDAQGDPLSWSEGEEADPNTPSAAEVMEGSVEAEVQATQSQEQPAAPEAEEVQEPAPEEG